MNSEHPKLTRFLYFKDEVILSLLNALLQEKDINECLFWISELYYSGYYVNTWIVLWTIFYDFYALKNPKLEYYIACSYRKWKKERNIKFVLNIIKNFHSNAHPTPDVFCMRLLLKSQQKKAKPAKRDRLPKTLIDVPIKFKKILLSIYRQDYCNIAFNIKKFKNHEEELFCAIFKYLAQGLSKMIPKTILNEKTVQKAKSAFVTNPYDDKIHILLALICNIYYHHNDLRMRNIFLSASANDVVFVKDIDAEPCIPVYKTLACKRIYSISKDIGCFKLIRNQEGSPSFPSYNKILWYHWEYFASFSPLWNERFQNYNVRKEDSTYEIRFRNDDESEEFYEKYGYEPDEQSKETQEKSILEIPPNSMKEWLTSIFGKHQLIDLIEDGIYSY